MSSMLGSLTILLQVGTVGTTKAVKEIRTIDRAAQATTSNINMSARNINSAFMSIGRTLTQFVTLPLGIMEVAAAKSFSKFEYNLSKVTGLVGIQAEVTEKWGKQVLRTLDDVAKGSGELSEALYFVTTGGIRGVETMEVLNTSAKLAAIGLGETKTVADILVSAMNAYGKANLNAAQAGDVLIRSVREGKAEADELVTSMGVVFPIASKLGVSFGEVGAGMAAMTRTGTTAATSAIQLRRILFGILKPSQQAEEALNAMGSSSQALRDTLKSGGLLTTLMEIKDMMEVFGEETIAQVFPNIRALAGVLDILGENLEENKKLFDSIANSGGDLERAFANVSETFKFKVNAALSAGNALMVKFGQALANALIPFFENVTERLKNLASWFDNLTKVQQNFIVKVAGIITVVGPLIAILSAVISMMRGVAVVFGFVETETAKHTAAIIANAAAIDAQTKATLKQEAAEIANMATKKEMVVTTASLAAAESKAMAATQAAANAQVRAEVAMFKYAKAKLALSASNAKLLIAQRNLITAEIAYEQSIKSGYGIQAAYNKAIIAEIAYKKVSTQVTREQVIVTQALTAVQAKKQKAEILTAGATKLQAEASRQAAVAMEAEAIAANNAAIAQSRFMASTGSSLLMTRQMTVAQLQNVQAVTATTVATKAATAATSAFSKALAAIPLSSVWAVIGALAIAQYLLIRRLYELTDLQKLQKKVTEDVANAIADETSELNHYLSVAKNESLSQKMRLEAMEKINQLSPTYLGNLKLESINTAQATAAVEAYTSSLKEQFRIKILQEELIELEREYTKEVITGADKRVTWLQKAFIRQQYIFGNLWYLYQTRFSWQKQLELQEERNARNNKRNFEEQKKYLHEQLADRQKVTDNIVNNYKYLSDQADLMATHEKQYQEAAKIAAEETAKAVAAVSKEGKTQIEYEQEVKKVTLESQKAIKQSYEEHRNQIMSTIERMSELLQSAKDQKEFLTTMVQTDIELNEYRANVIAAKTKKEREEWGKLYTERLRALQAIRDPQLASIDKIIEDLTKASDILSKMIGEKNLTVKVNIEIKKTWDQLKEDLRVLGRKKELFGWDDSNIEAIKEELKILEGVMDNVFKFTDKELPLTDPQLLSTYARWQQLTTIVKDHEEANKKAARSVADVWNDLDKTLSDITKKSQVFGKTYEDLEERAKATESAINEAIELGSKLDTARIKAHKSELDIINLILETRKNYNTSLDESVSKAKTLTELWKKDYGVQNDIKNKIEEAQQVLAKFTLQQKFPELSILDNVVDLEDLKRVMEGLEEAGLKFLPIYKTISDIIEKTEISKGWNEFAEKIAEIDEKLKIVGNDTELLDAKLRLLKQRLTALLRGPREDAESFKEELKETGKQIADTMVKIELLNMRADAVADVFTSLGESIGKAFMGADDAFDGLLAGLLNVVKKIGETLIGIGSFFLFIPGLQGLAASFLLAGTGIVALASAGSYAMEKSREREKEDANVHHSRAAKMAQGGMVPPGFPNDTYPAFLSSKEVVVPPPKKLPQYGSGEFTVKLPDGKWVIRGQDLHYIIKEMDRKYQGAYGS